MVAAVEALGRGALRRIRLDAGQLSSLFEEHGDGLLVFFARRTLDPEVALDLVGETFAVAFAKRRQFRGATRDEAVAWLYAIGRSALARYVRRGVAERKALRRLGVDRPEMSEDEHRRIEELAGLEELRAVVAGELDKLGGDQQLAIRLRIVDELPYDQVAQRLRVSEQAARARVSRGLRALTTAVTAATQQEGTDARR